MTLYNPLPRKEAKVTVIKEAKDVATLPLDELIGNLKVYEMILENDGVVSKTTKKKVKYLAVKAKITREQTSDGSDSQGGSVEDLDEEEAKAFNLIAKNFCFYNCGEEGHFIGECPKPKENKAFVGGAGSDSEDGNEPQNDTACLIAIDSQEFRRFLENKGEDGERMWYSITKGPYVRPMIADLDDPRNEMREPISKMTEANRKWYSADVERLMYGLEKNKHVIHSRLMNEFDKFEAQEGESLESVYERLSTLVNVMDHNDVRLIKVSINTKFLNSLQPEWSKYPHEQAFKAKKATKNHDPFALIAHSSQSHASPSYSQSPQPYYVTHTSLVIDYEEDYQRELQRDAQEDKLTTTMNAWIQNRNQAANAGNGQVQQIDESHYARDCPKPKVLDAKYFREHMLLALKDEAGGTLNEEENDFMLDNAYGDETLEELTVAVENNGGTVEHDSNAHD
ncbi:putative ribonuclease H-like domain-containing protein [Tanacetum coccineum]